MQAAVISHPASLKQAGTKPTNRSRVSNGSAILSDVDGRGVWVRRFRDVIESHVADLGGADIVSEAERSIVRRAAALTVELERLESQFATAGEATADGLDLYQRTAGSLRRLLEAVGLQRRTRPVGPQSMKEYAAMLRERDAAQ